MVDPLWDKIKSAVHLRDLPKVNRLIPIYLKAHSKSPEALYEASEFFRKISDYKNALRMLPKERSISKITKGIDAFTRLELQQARLLNILGASHYAIRVIDKLRSEKRAKSKVEIVEIYQCNYRYQEVVDFLGEDYPMPESEPWHQDWVLHFYLANCLNGLKKHDLAIERVRQIRRLSQSGLIQGITFHFEGKFVLSTGDAEKALAVLLEAKHFFAADDRTVDSANLSMSLGQCYLKLGELKKAEQELNRAFEAYYAPSFRPEDWLEVSLFLEQANSHNEVAPRVCAAFGSDYPALWRTGTAYQETADQIFSVSEMRTVRAKRHIDRASDTFWEASRPRLGLGLVDELISTLIYFGKYGAAQFRLYEMLWPNEPFSFDQHQKRLEHLVGRARAQGFEIEWEDFNLRLVSENISVSGRPEKVIRGKSFLQEKPVFTRRDVEKYFSISPSSAKKICREWVDTALTVPSGRTGYRALI